MSAAVELGSRRVSPGKACLWQVWPALIIKVPNNSMISLTILFQ